MAGRPLVVVEVAGRPLVVVEVAGRPLAVVEVGSSHKMVNIICICKCVHVKMNGNNFPVGC